VFKINANPSRIKYACNNCRYEFTRKATTEFRHCPYCGKTGTVNMQRNNYASRVLDEVSGMPSLGI